MRNSKTGSFKGILEAVYMDGVVKGAGSVAKPNYVNVKEALLDLRKRVEGKKYPVVRNYVARKAEWISGYNQAIQNIVEDFI